MNTMQKVQEAIKEAMKNKDIVRLETLRMVKSALLLKEKSVAREGEMPESEAVQALRGEIRKRKESIEVFKQVGKNEEVEKLEKEIAIIEEFLPKQLSREEIIEKVQKYIDEHPEINHPGKLTGIMKKEIGDAVDGKVLNEICTELLSKKQ